MRGGWVKCEVVIVLLALVPGASSAPSGSEVQFSDITERSKVDFTQQNSANERRLHFGLGAETRVDLVVRWPNGVSETVSKVAANQLVVIREGSGITRRERF